MWLAILSLCMVGAISRSPTSGVVSISKEVVDSGAIKVDVSFHKVKNVGILIRVLPSTADQEGSDACDPHAAVFRSLDIRDASDLVAHMDTPMVSGGVWAVSDDSADSVRTYSAVLSPALLRQHFSAQSGYGAIAVSGGSIAARVRACAYEIVPQTGDMTSIIDAAHVDVVSRDGASAGPGDVTAVVVSIAPEGDDRVSLVIETRTSSTASVGVSRRGLSAVPAAQVVPETGISVNCGSKMTECTAKIAGQRSRASRGSSRCASTGTDKNGATECVQRWTVSVGKSDLVAKGDAQVSFVDLVLGLVATQIAKSDERATQFSLHVRAPIPRDSAHVAAKSGAARLAAVVRIDGMPEQRVPVQKAGARSVMSKATLSDSANTCVDLSVEGFSGAGTVIEIVEAGMSVCEDGGETCDARIVLPMIRNGRIVSDFARNVRGRMIKSEEGTRLCYVPSAALQGQISIKWEAIAPGVRRETEPRSAPIGWNDKPDHHGDHHPPTPPPDHRPHPDWCEHEWGCTGTIDIDAAVNCRSDEIFDRTYGACMSDSDYGTGSYVVAIVAALFGLVLFGVIVMMFLSAWGFW
jgi:hypothetical protein